jgi:hypothetical protein
MQRPCVVAVLPVLLLFLVLLVRPDALVDLVHGRGDPPGPLPRRRRRS